MIAIINGKVITVTGEKYEKADILVENGKIAAIGSKLPIPEGADVVDASGMWVTPGLIDAHSHLGFGEGFIIADATEATNPFTPYMSVRDCLNPQDYGIGRAIRAGFTAGHTQPGSSNIIGGTGITIKLKETCLVDDLIIPDSEQMKMALGENPKRTYKAQGKAPTTRAGIGGMLRKYLFEARQYSEALKKAEQGLGPAPQRNFELDAMVPLIRRQMKARIHCHRIDDIQTAVRICHEYDLDFALEHVTEGYMIADYLVENRVRCVLGPFMYLIGKSEIWNMREEGPGIMERAGMNDFCLTADGGPATNYLPVHVGYLIGHGLSEDLAFRAMTINPARLLGIDGRTGSLEVGKDADIAVFNGHPFSNMTRCMATMTEGVFYHNMLVTSVRGE